MKYFVLFIVAFCALSAATWAEDNSLSCQYRYNTTEQIEVQNVYSKVTNQLITDSLTPTEFEGKPHCYFRIYNNYDYALTFRMMFKLTVNSDLRFFDEDITILPRDYYLFGLESRYAACHVDQNSFKITFIDNNETYAKYENVENVIEHCKLCNGTICLDDGAECSSSLNCGSGFCIRGVCSADSNCFQNNCECGENEIQCNNNRCVPRRALGFGIKTSCNLPEECISGTIDSAGICIKTQVQIKQEEEAERLAAQKAIELEEKERENAELAAQKAIELEETEKEKEKIRLEEDTKKTLISNISMIFVAGTFAVIICISLVVGAWLLWRKIENDRLRVESIKIVAETEARQQRINDKVTEITNLTQNYTSTKIKLERDTKENRQKLSLLEQEYAREKQEIENKMFELEIKNKKAWANIKPFPDPLANNRLVIINPYLGGYFCFYHPELKLEEYPFSALLHHWIWKKHNGRWPKIGYHIHHKDGDKYNNSIENLEEIDGDEHYRMHRM